MLQLGLGWDRLMQGERRHAMIQVDFFWSYGLGAGFALAAGRQLIKEEKKSGSVFQNKYFTNTLLFMSLFFVPSGVCLLWAFTNWETMQVFSYRTLPAWLVTLFVITNITQGILGFWVVSKLLMKKKKYMAFLQVALAYFIMFFILGNTIIRIIGISKNIMKSFKKEILYLPVFLSAITITRKKIANRDGKVEIPAFVVVGTGTVSTVAITPPV
jgi:hypothetical protein